MGIMDKVKDVFVSSDAPNSALAKQHRIQQSVISEFNRKIGRESFKQFASEFDATKVPGGYRIIEEENLDQYEAGGLIQTDEFAGEEFFTVTDRGRYAIENFEEIRDEIEVLEQISDQDTDIIDDISQLEDQIPSDYNMGRDVHGSGLKEKQHVTHSGQAEWRITSEGKEIKNKIEELSPILTARLTVLPSEYESEPADVVKTLKKYSAKFQETKLSEQILNTLGEAVESSEIGQTIDALNVYKDMLTDTDVRQVAEKSDYVADMRNQIEGVTSIYDSVIRENGCIALCEEMNESEVEQMLNSDAREIYEQVAETHRNVYQH